jgi:hypothetical protein
MLITMWNKFPAEDVQQYSILEMNQGTTYPDYPASYFNDHHVLFGVQWVLFPPSC